VTQLTHVRLPSAPGNNAEVIGVLSGRRRTASSSLMRVICFDVVIIDQIGILGRWRTGTLD
jgi:hypothetical protein